MKPWREGKTYAELGLGDPSLTDEQLLDAIEANPVLLNRPFVVTKRGVRLCRPSEAVLDILPLRQMGPFAKEDGEGCHRPGRKSSCLTFPTPFLRRSTYPTAHG